MKPLMMHSFMTEHDFELREDKWVCKNCDFEMKANPLHTYSLGFFQSEEYRKCDNIRE